MAGQIVMGYNFFNNKIKIKILDNKKIKKWIKNYIQKIENLYQSFLWRNKSPYQLINKNKMSIWPNNWQ